MTHAKSADIAIERLMHTGLLTCTPDTPLREATERMASRRCSSILVMDNHQAVGIWTERDSLRLDLTRPDNLDLPIRRVMSQPVNSLPRHTPVSEAEQWFRQHQCRHLLVVDDDGLPIGMVSQTDMALKQGLEPYLSLRRIKEAMNASPLVLPGTLSLARAATELLSHNQDAAVVSCSPVQLGIITERDMVRCIARHPGNTPIGELASRPLLSVSPDDSLLHARDLLIDNRVRHLVVRQGNKVVGLVGFREIINGVEHRYLEQLQQALAQRDQALHSSRLNLQLAERVIEASLESIVVTDADNRIVFVNPSFTHTTGYSAEEVIGRTPAMLSSGRHDAAFYQSMWKTLHEQGYWRGEIWNRRKSGQLYLELLTITAIQDDNGNITHFAALFTDITHIRENEDKVRRLAYYDPLTGLPNRRLLEDRLELAIRHANRSKQHLAVIFLDLDHFKQVNDTLGHAAGDELLLDVSRRIRARLREDDTLARLGGDEFIVLLPELNETDEASRVARRLIDAIAEPFNIHEQPFRIGCSLGISLYPDDANSAEELLHHADAAMYQVKQEGRNDYRLFSRNMNRQQHQLLAMETALRYAVETGEGLSVHYQPQVSRAGRSLAGAEALARWHHPEFGQVSPAEFIPLAERAGLMVPLGMTLLHQVAAQQRRWMDMGMMPVPVSVNLSAQQFWQHNLLVQFRLLLAEHRLPAGLIGIELTESVLLDKQQQAIPLLYGLRELGCAIAIDDFGTGYSSLSYLQDLPVNSLKIDRSFIQRLGESRSSNAILAAVTGLARELEFKVVAEGVETEEQMQALDRYPVDLIQGYLTGRPVPADDFAEQWLNTVRCEG
ncbi:EAL domain-containing protein [Oceanimonas sp. CHS3-5]|uniref:EAL domain-containing protein n=1 Tax=Oceanimonas sp. CHS3-5 TaxID=3068186 RepID=UPI00273FEE85|nr:EAL domain-containing protein [Oceanimonas sp. CHS3-5]MDP5291130.1 EAL domain-containing protein [Oceanimonas sp. CHS3-5]